MTPPDAATGRSEATAGVERCALCGWSPQDGPGRLRRLGAEPVAITVCQDRDDCVRRFEGSTDTRRAW